MKSSGSSLPRFSCDFGLRGVWLLRSMTSCHHRHLQHYAWTSLCLFPSFIYIHTHIHRDSVQAWWVDVIPQSKVFQAEWQQLYLTAKKAAEPHPRKLEKTNSAYQKASVTMYSHNIHGVSLLNKTRLLFYSVLVDKQEQTVRGEIRYDLEQSFN